MGRYEVSERRATRAARFCLSSIRYQSCRDPLTTLRQRMRELAHSRVRFGYRRLLVLLRREGWELGKKRCYRLYIEEGLALRRKRPWRHATAVHREQRRPSTKRNDIWSMDFVADELADGRISHAHNVRLGSPKQGIDTALRPAIHPGERASDLNEWALREARYDSA